MTFARPESAMTARARLALLLSALALSASCNLQEPAAIDGLAPDPATDTLAITPQNVAVPIGDSIVFIAPAQTVEGTEVSGPVEWTVAGAAGGSISTTGLFRATAPGDFTVRARRSGHTGRSRVLVAAATPTLASVTIAPGAVTLQPGASFTFALSGLLTDGTTVPVTATWGATGGTVTAAGVYTAGGAAGTFRVIATQQGGTLADTAAIVISAAAPTLQAIEVTPATVTLAPGGTQQFNGVGRMSDGSTASVAVAWVATGGTVTGSGQYTAGTTAGAFRVIAVEQGGTRADTSTVTITVAAPTLQAVEVTPATVNLAPGGAQQFSAVGRMSDGTTGSVTVNWSATGGAVTAAGAYTAGAVGGTFRVIATQQGSTRADTSSVTIAVPPPTVTLQAVEVTPATVNVLTGGTQQFSAVGRMSDGSTAGVTVAWSATGGTVSTAGRYTAGSTPGAYRVIAVQQGGTMADTSAVTTSAPAPTLQAVVMTPASVSLATGATQQFSAVGQMSDGSTASVAVTYAATGGTVSAGGLYTAGIGAGTFRIIATEQGGTRADTSSITLTAPAPTLTAVELTPATVSLGTGATQQFAAVGRMSDGSTSSIAITWSATGGTVNATGLYSAGTTAGTYRVIAIQQGGTRADTSAVTITAPAPTLTAVELTPATVSLGSGATQQFSALGRLSDGSATTVTVTYNATGGTITAGGLYTAGSTTGSFQVIATQTGGILADTAAVTITTPPPPGTGTALFSSDWSSGTGTTDAVLRDTSKPVPWSNRWGGNGSLAVVSASGLGFPATMANVLRVLHYQQDFDWVMANNLWAVPAVGSSIYFRVYLRNTVSDAVDAGTAYASTHPVESEGGANSISGGYYAMHYASYSDGKFPFFVAFNNASYPYSGWTPGAPSSTHGGRNYDPATLNKATTYRLEWKFTRRAANVYDFDMRIYGGDDTTLLYDRSSIYAWGGNGQTLATNGTNLAIDDSHVTDLRFGINGGFAAPSPQYVYWGGFAVCANDWCGRYGSF